MATARLMESPASRGGGMPSPTAASGMLGDQVESGLLTLLGPKNGWARRRLVLSRDMARPGGIKVDSTQPSKKS